MLYLNIYENMIQVISLRNDLVMYSERKAMFITNGDE